MKAALKSGLRFLYAVALSVRMNHDVGRVVVLLMSYGNCGFTKKMVLNHRNLKTNR